MILVDASIWVDHLRSGVPKLTAALQNSKVFIHPWVVGELACGNLRDRSRVLQLLQSLPSACVATPAEVQTLIDQHHLMGRGIGFVDAQLLASARLSSCMLWTQDRRLAELAEALGVHSEI